MPRRWPPRWASQELRSRICRAEMYSVFCCMINKHKYTVYKCIQVQWFQYGSVVSIGRNLGSYGGYAKDICRFDSDMTSSRKMCCPGQGSSWGPWRFCDIEGFQVDSIFSIGLKMDIERSQIYPSMKSKPGGTTSLSSRDKLSITLQSMCRCFGDLPELHQAEFPISVGPFCLGKRRF